MNKRLFCWVFLRMTFLVPKELSDTASRGCDYESECVHRVCVCVRMHVQVCTQQGGAVWPPGSRRVCEGRKRGSGHRLECVRARLGVGWPS